MTFELLKRTFVLAVCILICGNFSANPQTKRKTSKRSAIVKTKTKQASPRSAEKKGKSGNNAAANGEEVVLVNPGNAPDSSEPILEGILNQRAANLELPNYPAAAKAVRAAGAVNVQVVVDENGDVITAKSVSGHPLLRLAAEQAARASKFYPTRVNGKAVKVRGIIIYNFAAQ